MISPRDILIKELPPLMIVRLLDELYFGHYGSFPKYIIPSLSANLESILLKFEMERQIIYYT
jgi:hypothetical protein